MLIKTGLIENRPIKNTPIKNWRRRILGSVALLFVIPIALAQQPPAPSAATLPGMSWESLAALPDLLNAQWVPSGVSQDEQKLLKNFVLPPLKADFIDDAKAAVANAIKDQQALWTASCKTDGQPRLAWYPYPLQFMYGAGNVMIQEARQVRQIPVNGINHPTNLDNPDDSLLGLTVNGDVRGVWEGNTLVVDTIAVRDAIDTFYGVPNDPDLRVTERYRLVDKNTLERQTTVLAPNFFTKPWVTRTTYRRRPATSLASTFCEPAGGWFVNSKAATR